MINFNMKDRMFGAFQQARIWKKMDEKIFKFKIKIAHRMDVDWLKWKWDDQRFHKKKRISKYMGRQNILRHHVEQQNRNSLTMAGFLKEKQECLIPNVGDTFRYDNHRFRVTGWLKKNHREKYIHCHRSEAQFISGSGVCGVVLPVSEVVVDGRVNWPDERIAEERHRAERLVGAMVFYNGGNQLWEEGDASQIATWYAPAVE